jgi:hypothetical protein
MAAAVSPLTSRAPNYRPGAFSLRNAWIPIYHATRVKTRTVRRAIHGEPVHLWRDRSTNQLRATCVAPQWLDGRGPSAASEFTDGTGAYPIIERYGYAWVWYGDPTAADPALIPNIPFLPEEGLARSSMTDVVWDCSYELQIENTLDLTHADLLHATFFGKSSKDDQIVVDSTSETVTMTRVARNRDIPIVQRLMKRIPADKQDAKMVNLVHVRSGVILTHIVWDPGVELFSCMPANPESSTRSRTPGYMILASGGWAKPLFAPLGGHLIGRQDNVALRPQNRGYVEGAARPDVSSRFDKAGLRFRKGYQALVGRQLTGDYSYRDDGDPARDVTSELCMGVGTEWLPSSRKA